MYAALFTLFLAAPTPESALAEILPPASREVVQDLSLPGLPRPGEGIDFHAEPQPSSDAQVLIAHLVARQHGRVIYARRLTIPLRTQALVPVPIRTIRRGAVITRDDVAMREIHVPSPALVATDLHDVVGREARRALLAGRVIPLRSIEREVLVARGDPVRVTVSAGGLRIVLDGRALEPGAKGETVRVVNGQSNEIVTARVVARGELEVAP